MNTREAALRNKPECADKYLKGYYVDTIDQSIEKAMDILKSIKF